MPNYSSTVSWGRSLAVLTLAIALIAVFAPVYAEKASSGQRTAVASSAQPGPVADQGKGPSMMEKELDLGRGEGLLAKCPPRGGRTPIRRPPGGGGGGPDWGAGWGGGLGLPGPFGGWLPGGRGITLSDDGSKKIEDNFKAIDDLIKASPGEGGSTPTGTRKIKSDPSAPTPSAKDLLDGSSPMTDVAEAKPEGDLPGNLAELFCQ